ncbi:nucleotide exchange factor GrpE [Candidatus Woesearchaeota archaeon]|jgi:molecular chaperone GrpE|nr:nucleotide exchange factor GrpE [Candidatus Woesearchaeota archaeon]MBT4387188.1 nucleotide exchange factor GrpE [Candidatus Woesearchaeota archaeon]MBT4596055.1 nucleotide exchange factor GrpE [Candidatus Woesearchaeota archaeon]MBT5740763.1 nucleotide exchange factor GrpE [Candidatus Woesearchaeota archaeon]MBT6506077.1 nucleotide exchange factor GrpE [Candidatus Woesearchaeota archaeon]
MENDENIQNSMNENNNINGEVEMDTSNSELSNEDKLILENKDLINTLQRLQAEFDNYRKRSENEKKDFANYALRNTILDLLPILDNFSLALMNIKENDEFTKGVELIYAQFFTTLEKIGLKKIDTKDKMFDPNYHEVLMNEESDKEKDIILEEFQIGYMLGDKVLRPSKVKIAK